MSNVPARIEHTVLGPTTNSDDVTTALDIALRDGMKACLPPCYVAEATEYAPNLEIVTVVGFPHGQHTTATKCHEAREAWEDGADEIDMVANIGRLRSGEDERFEQDIAEVVATVPIPVKVIVEAPLLDDEELRRACQAAADADADFVKTATGFSEGGATVEAVEVMSEYLPVKASGGIGSWEKAKAMFDAGAERIGASSGDDIVAEYQQATGSSGTTDEAAESDQ